MLKTKTKKKHSNLSQREMEILARDAVNYAKRMGIQMKKKKRA